MRGNKVRHNHAYCKTLCMVGQKKCKPRAVFTVEEVNLVIEYIFYIIFIN